MAKFENVDSRGPGKPYAPRTVENREVAEPGPALAAMRCELDMVDRLLGGTLAMRDAKRDYLPQHEYETSRAYDRRLAQSYLDNYVLRTLNTLVGKAFKEPPSPGPDMDTTLVDFLDDVDGAGTGIVPFSRALFREGVKGAVSYVLVDTPALQPTVDGVAPSLADQAKAGGPTWRIIPTCDMLDYREGKTEHGIRPTMIRFRDDVVEDDGQFGSRLVERVKVIRSDGWELWELKKGPRGGKPKWEKVEEGVLDTGYVPVVPFYTDRSGTGEGRSPLADLAHLNVRHWQSTSDQINILTVCRFPILAGSGIPDDGMPAANEDLTQPSTVVGPNKFLTTPDPQGKIYWVEHTGAAVEAGKGELERLEQAMASYGAEFLKKGAQGPETASGRVLDAGEAISPLQSWGIDFRDALMLALFYTAEAMGNAKAKVDLLFEIDSEVGMGDSSELSTLDAARERKDISRRAWVDEMKRRGILVEDYDADDDKEEIDREPPPPGTGLDGMAGGLSGAKGATKPPAKP